MSRERIIYELGGSALPKEAVAVNNKEVEIEINYDSNDPDAEGTVTINNWDFEGVAADRVNEQFEGGLTEGVGVGEGLPFKVSIQDDVSKLTILDAYLEMGSPDAIFEKGRVKLPSKLRGGIDWLEDSADSAEYSIIDSEGLIDRSTDVVSIPYIISSIPNRQDIAMLTLSGFVIIAQIKTVINDLIILFVDFAGAASAIRAAIKILLYIIYLVILIISLVKLIKDLINAIIQPVKYHTGMKLITLLEKGAEFLGLKFESTIFDNDPFWQSVVILPAKYKSFRDPKDKKLFGSKKPRPAKTTPYFDGSFGELLRICKTVFNARIIVGDNIVRLERVDSNIAEASYTLPNVEQKIFTHNFKEFSSTYNLRFAIDQTESNTIDNYEGTVTNVVPQPTVVKNKDMTQYGGAVRRNVIPFARGSRKLELTPPEKFLDIILKAVGAVFKALLSIAPPAIRRKSNLGEIFNVFGNRIGMLSLENDFFTIHKMIGYDLRTDPVQNKVSLDNAIKINTSFLYDNFHFVNSGVPTAEKPNANQWLIYNARIPFCKEDFELLLLINNNRIFDTNGDVAKIMTLRWLIDSKIANVVYRVNKLFLSSIEEFKNTPDGE